MQRRVSVRVRILTAVLITTAIGMIGAGTVSYLIARQSTYADIRNSLNQENEEIKTVARLAESGQSARTVATPSDLLYLAIRSSVPDPGEAIFGMVNDQVAWVPDSADAFQRTIVADPELLSAAAAVPADQSVTVRRLHTAQHDRLAFVSIPVQVRGSQDLGHFVAVVDVDAAFAPINRTHLIFAAICALALLVVGLVGYQVAGRLLSPLRTLRRTAQRISETDLSERIPSEQLSSRDEVADLGWTMNAMLDRLAASFDNQRQILDDAGHELRTPITIVRGHLELTDVNDWADVTRTRDLAIDELDRMQRLVEELMVLAKARRPDFVQLAPVELDGLLLSVLDKITPLADRRWTVDQLDEAVVPLDAQRITQALVQLVANAIRFTENADVIAVGGAVEDDTVRIWVRDAGVGVSETDQEMIFQRFRRGSTTDDDHGAGLGLAIVAAIAEAHRGEVRLDSGVGQGATFSLILPTTQRGG